MVEPLECLELHKMKRTEVIVDALTGIETFREYDETPEEQARRIEAELEAAERAAKEAEFIVRKKALLEKLGINAEEAKILLS